MHPARLVCALLTLTLSLGALSACAEETELPDESASATEPATEEHDLRSPLPVPEALGGFKFTVITSDWRIAAPIVCPEKLEAEPINDAVYESDRKVEDAYHCEMGVYKVGGYEEITKEVQRHASAGSHDFALSLNHDKRTVTCAINGCYLDIRRHGSYDFDAPWWTRTADSFLIGGKQYFASNYMVYSGIYMSLVLAYNKDLAKKRGVVVPFDKIRNGEWTIDDLIGMTQDAYVDLNGDGAMRPSDDLFGFASQWQGGCTIVLSCDYTCIEKGEDGYPVFRPDEERLSAVAEKWEALMAHGYKADGKDGGEYATEHFLAERLLVDYLEVRNAATSLRDTPFSVGYLPVPKLNVEQKDYITGSFDLYWGVMQPAEADAWKVSDVAEALGYYCYYDVVPVVFETTLKCKLSESPEDALTFDIMRDSLFVDTGYALSDDVSGLDPIVQALNKTTAGGIGSLFGKNAKLVEKNLPRFCSKWSKLP